jgi:hypothetical protein
MGFFSSFGRNIGGMFGLTGVLPETETQKLQAKLATAKETMSSAFRAGILSSLKEQLKFNSQITALVLSDHELSAVQSTYNLELEQHDKSITNIKLIINLAIVLVIFCYLMFLPKCC